MTSMRDAKITDKTLLVDSFKKVVQETVVFSDGQEEEWVYLDSPKSIMVVALTPEQKLVLVKLYRHNIKQDVYELPAGGKEKDDEDALDAAKRELQEETGFTSDNFIDLGVYYVLPSETNRWVQYYLAKNAQKTQEPQLDDLIEKYFDMSVEVHPLESIPIMLGMESLFGLQLAKAYLKSN